jgi:hypothetical protein
MFGRDRLYSDGMNAYLFLTFVGWTAAAMVVGAGVLQLIPRLGRMGGHVSEALCRAPALDWVVTYFTMGPLLVGAILGGWRGLVGAVVGQVAGGMIWVGLHEAAHPAARRGPRIVKFHKRLGKAWRNMLALWLTALATPIFWQVRLAEVFVWTPITWLVGLPRYRGAEWVNVSRHKFDGLIGHDLIWCLYCDWMTGVWSLASEMLRNVESYWCPIRFYSEKKCANCAVDFPDINGGWVDADGTLADVVSRMESMYGGGQRGWFGHPARLTINGEAVEKLEGAEAKAARNEENVPV